MALSEPENKIVLDRLRGVKEPLSWRDWMATMKGIPGMKSGECRTYYMAKRFGDEWATWPKGRSSFGRSVPPGNRRVWKGTPARSPPASAPPHNVRDPPPVDSRGDIVGESAGDSMRPSAVPDTPLELLKVAPPADLWPESLGKLGQAELLGCVREHLPD